MSGVGRDTRLVDGSLALLRAPDGFAPYIQLSFYLYPWCIKELRRRLSWEHNRQGVIVIRLGVPIDVPPIELAIEGKSLYLYGVRAVPDGPWWCFRDFRPRPPDPPGAPARWEIPSDGSYTDLGLPDTIDHAPLDLLRGVRAFDGRLNPERARDLVALMLLVPEALRFESLLDEGMRYLHDFHMHPAAHRATVTNWKAGTLAGDRRNVALPWLP